MNKETPLFTREETNLIYYFATEKNSARRFGFYASVLAAPAIIACYGLVQRDHIALAVGFFGLFGMVIWYISTERRYAKQFRSICEKLVTSGAMSPKENP
jgi:hypothetical protein